MRLFLLPPGGSSAALFRSWHEALKGQAEVVPVELPGRGTRFAEPLRTSIPELVDELVSGFTPDPGELWAVVGHSMGSLLGAAWSAAVTHQPSFLMVSGSAPPWLHSTAAALAGTDDEHWRPEELWRKIGALGGLPPAARDNPAAQRLLGRILHADVTACLRYRPTAPTAVACPVIAVRGADDPLVDARLFSGWAALTDQPFHEITLPGGHFYQQGIDDLIPLVADLLRGTAKLGV